LQRTLRRDQRQQGSRGRPLERSGDAKHEGRDEDVHLIEPACVGPPAEKQRRQCLNALADLHDALALKPVRRLPCDEDQQRGRKELHEPDHAEVEGAAGEIVNLPADRDRADLAREAGQAPRQQKENEGRPPEERAGARRCEGGHS